MSAKVGGIAAIESGGIGPFEAGWREFRRRERVIATRAGTIDVPVEDLRWSEQALLGLSITAPATSREWAALAIIALYCKGSSLDSVFDDVLDTIEGILGPEADVEAAAW
ncbi:MAG: hypothetical protein AAF318_12660 [Pseudomonadota bacterium]